LPNINSNFPWILIFSLHDDEIDISFWKVAEIAIRIPKETEGHRSGQNFSPESSPLQQFAKEVQKQTKRYKNFEIYKVSDSCS
jgi:hypothetical protein